ncbi:MAG: 23S rRNA (adenine(2503)-C(2))-methyltransferase RlmN [Lachnospiraceae bacterium]|jgi:23S rRNA (adenine2503-C2)-methyltransferase|nr:23S rRNA (adenine(2503)-C(2))-methyltransferase RlmN [Lachnospiraceae bacterium]
MDMRIDIKSLDFEELNNLVLELGEKSFRAKQIYEWLHVKLVHSFEEMSNLSKNLRDKLNEKCFLTALKPVEILTSKVDGTKKYLFELQDGNIIESVLMRYHHGNSVCISTQVGCRMGCKFCASTLDGLERNLLPSEMLDEIYSIQKDIGERVSNIVLMGSGEPLDNYDNVMKFLKLISDDYGLNISQRNITLSTCGLVPKIYELADSQVQITLAISLHASEDETRKELMPVAKAYKIDEILKACNYYFDKTGRRLTFEYSLVSGINDTVEGAVRLGELLKGINCHVNLIPVNPIKERDFKQSEKQAIEKFKNKLEKYGINVTIRREMGRDINGACGQLRKSYNETKKTKEGES